MDGYRFIYDRDTQTGVLIDLTVNGDAWCRFVDAARAEAEAGNYAEVDVHDNGYTPAHLGRMLDSVRTVRARDGTTAAVILEFATADELWEDFFDTVHIDERRGEPTISMEELSAHLDQLNATECTALST